LNALILAGKQNTNRLEINNELNNKALLLINEIPMIEYVVNALIEAKEIQNIVVVGPEYDLAPFIEKKVNKILDATDSIIKNIEIGLDYFKDDYKLLVLTSDIPLITGEIIDRFIKKCEQYEALFYYPFITRETILQKYPQTIRSYAVLKEGVLCGGNIAIFARPLFEKNRDLLNELYQKRKDVKKYASLLGIKFIVKYLLKTLSIKEIEERAEEIVGYPVKSILIEDPEVMIDLDKLSDYELILQVINQKKN
jgi:molybdopterin-guanine dinucleotide biosynthesis protein A